MARLGEFVRSRSVNASFAWALVGLLAASAAWNALEGDLLWAAFDATVAAVALAPTVATRDGTVLVPWPVLLVAAAPAAARWAGALVEPTTYLSVAGLALLVAAEVDAFSAAEMPSWFAVTFVVLATMAIAGVWGVVQYYSDVALGTSFLPGRAELMWDLVAATAVGLAAGVLFELYFRRVVSDDHRPRGVGD